MWIDFSGSGHKVYDSAAPEKIASTATTLSDLDARIASTREELEGLTQRIEAIPADKLDKIVTVKRGYGEMVLAVEQAKHTITTNGIARIYMDYKESPKSRFVPPTTITKTVPIRPGGVRDRRSAPRRRQAKQSALYPSVSLRDFDHSTCRAPARNIAFTRLADVRGTSQGQALRVLRTLDWLTAIGFLVWNGFFAGKTVPVFSLTPSKRTVAFPSVSPFKLAQLPMDQPSKSPSASGSDSSRNPQAVCYISKARLAELIAKEKKRRTGRIRPESSGNQPHKSG